MAKRIADLLGLLDEQERKLLITDTPQFRPPMTARLGRHVFSDEDWLFERKLDGARCLAVCRDAEVHLYDRTGKLLDDKFPDIATALLKLPDGSVVDGEIVAFDGRQTRFELLQPYLYPEHPQDSQAPASHQTLDDLTGRQAQVSQEKRAPCWFYLFDLLQLGPYDLRNLPLISRKKILRNLIRFSRPLRFTNHRKGDGEHLFEIACEKGWEGVIAKRAASPYRSNRSRDWLKFRCDHQQELVIGGYTEPQGSRGDFGALLMGFFEGNKLRYAGKVGAGFDGRALTRLKRAMDQYRQSGSPFADPVSEKNCHWLAPELVCEVGFSEWTRDRKLRHPRYLGLRSDIAAHQVVRVNPEEAA